MGKFFKTSAQVVGVASFCYLLMSYWFMFKNLGYNFKAHSVALCVLFIFTPVLVIVSNFCKFVIGS